MANPLPNAMNIMHGDNILPLKRLQIMSEDDWEQFTEEWLDTKKGEYFSIERFGGAGDKGRDVAAYVTDSRVAGYVWDCYQCKHYDEPLMPSKVWVELGKIIYYSFLKDYPAPRKYYFVAPKGCGTTLSTFLKQPDDLKKGLKENWEKNCKKAITSTVDVDLTGDLLSYLNSFNFAIFDKIAPKDIIEEHKLHSNHLVRFGGALAPREALNETSIPAVIQSYESNYVTQLLNAYGSDCSKKFDKPDDIDTPYSNHFKRARISFHYAEQLRNLYRDSLPPGTFDNFQQELYDGTINIYESNYPNGYAKVKAVENQAAIVQITSNPLREVSVQKDRIGICHQLCNEKKFQWL